MLIVIEGIDGAGITTHTKLLANWLSSKGYRVVLTKEPTQNPIGAIIRRYLNMDVPPQVDALLFAADRVEHAYSVVGPALEKGFIVLCDRYLESSLAYQSAEGLDLDWLLNINRYAPKPDLTIILDVDPSISLRRKRLIKPEKFENESFLRIVRANFLKRAVSCGYPVVNTNRLVEEVQQELRGIVTTFLKSRMLEDLKAL